MKKETAVDFLHKKHMDILWLLSRNTITESVADELRAASLSAALHLEKELIIDGYDAGADERHNHPVNGEQYYNETYGGEQ
jgi:hypothetical protein